MKVESALLAGKHVLVVEDEMLIAMLIEDMLVDQGCTVIGPFNTLASALDAARTERFDLAILDVNLAGEKVYPVAEALTARHIPFLFLSGYGDTAIPKGKSTWRVCSKPFKGLELTTMLSETLAAGHG
ncbi:response regulator [Rhodopila sp.]|uniref:response regulator n=1 Tax=Rhodopila sp. TaxID=2480087 RepID=UPI003D0FE71F